VSAACGCATSARREPAVAHGHVATCAFLHGLATECVGSGRHACGHANAKNCAPSTAFSQQAAAAAAASWRNMIPSDSLMSGPCAQEGRPPTLQTDMCIQPVAVHRRQRGSSNESTRHVHTTTPHARTATRSASPHSQKKHHSQTAQHAEAEQGRRGSPTSCHRPIQQIMLLLKPQK
jgi:hypothetical protein